MGGAATSPPFSRRQPRRLAPKETWLATFLPWITSAFPEWFLPSNNIIIKREKTDKEAVIAKELFDTEVQAYERLKDLQGLLVPICYGQVHAFNDSTPPTPRPEFLDFHL